ncbi:MAG: tetratricopeptide repeat protein [Cyanobacteria bacterium J06621_11]
MGRRPLADAHQQTENRQSSFQHPEAREHNEHVTGYSTVDTSRGHANNPARSFVELADRAFLAECKGHDTAAEILYLESLSLQPHPSSKPHPSRGRILASLAELYTRQARYKEAEPLLQQSLQLHLQQDAEGEAVGEISYQLAHVLQHQQRYAEADDLFQRAWRLLGRHLGSQHPRTQAVYQDLMRLLMMSIETGRFEELNAGSTPLDLDHLSERYSWAKPAWQQS